MVFEKKNVFYDTILGEHYNKLKAKTEKISILHGEPMIPIPVYVLQTSMK